MKKKGFIRYNLIRIISGICVAALLSSSIFLFFYYGYSINLKSDHLSQIGFFTEHNLRLLLYSYKGIDLSNNYQLSYLQHLIENYGYDYIRFARVTENGDLECIYETEYDSVELTGLSWMLASRWKQLLYLTENPKKAGKKEYLFKNDPSEFKLYVRCDEAVAKMRENSDKKRLVNSRIAWFFPYEGSTDVRIVAPLYWHEYNAEQTTISDMFSESLDQMMEKLFNKLRVDNNCYYYNVRGTLNYIDNTVKDVEVLPLNPNQENPYQGAEDIDTCNLPDLVTFDSYAYVPIRPDKIFEKYNRELVPERSVLKEMRNKSLGHVEVFDIIPGFSPIEKLTKYGPISLSGTSDTISDEGYLVNYGYLKVNDELYFYTYILPYAGFWESFGVNLSGVAVLIFTLCISVAILSGIIPYRRYSTLFGRAQFKNMLLEALAQNIKAPVNDIVNTASKLNEVEDPEETDRLADRVLSTVSEMNNTVEEVLKGADSDGAKTKFRLNDAIEEAAAAVGIRVKITDGISIKTDRELLLRALRYLLKDACVHVDSVDVHIHNFKSVISFDKDDYIPGKGIVAADRLLSMANMQLIISYDGKKVREEIRYRSRYEQ